MKCKDCESCHKGYFESKYDERIKNIIDSNKIFLTYLYEQEIRDIDNAIKTLEAIKQRSMQNGSN